MNPGDLIHGRFLVERFVARGGMGEVYRALDQHTQQHVALKLVASDDAKLAERFQLEARALIELDHPAIVRYVAHGEASATELYLAMEWLSGVTLSQRVRKGEPLSIDEALRLGARVADGLGAAHALGMVHRDIKPDNLFLVEGRVDRVKILDFGLVRNPLQAITAHGAGLGTPDYMAPEQARCESNVGPAADLFALGCVLFRCLTGQSPFRADHVNAILAKIAMLEHPPRVARERPDIPTTVDVLVAKLMAHDPALRPRDGAAAAEMIREVRARLDGAERHKHAPENPALTIHEQRPVAVLFIELASSPSGYESTQPAERSPRRYAVRATGVTAHTMSLHPSADTIMLMVREIVEPVGGRVVRLVNGALVVLLSGGAAAPELATRAARCALAIRKVVPQAGISLATRQVVIDDYRAAGPVYDGAAALERSSRIRIDKRTRELLPEHFEVEGDDSRGLSLLGERASESGPRPVLGKHVPCVGRQGVLRQMQTSWETCVEDRAAQALVVVGEAGVGKSRLRTELLGRVRESKQPAQVVLAQGDALRSGVPAGMIGRALRTFLGLPDDAPAAQQAMLRARVGARLQGPDAERVAEFIGQIAGVPPQAVESIAMRAAQQDPQLMADQKRRAFADWLAAECRAQPVLLVIDDLQWADPVSVDLIGAALRRGRDLPLFVLAFARPELGSRFPRLDADWGRQELRVEPLRPAACAEVARHVLGDDTDPVLIESLVGRSGGNPFYLEELIRAAASPDSVGLPPSVLASTQLRIGKKPPRARQVLRAASLFGRVFWAGGVEALLRGEMEPQELADWLTQLERDELIERRPNARHFAHEVEFAFRHDLVRDAAYQMLTPEDRRIGHRLAGAWLVEHREGDAVVLAEHFAGGGVTHEAVSWFERAAEQALAGAAADKEALRKAAGFYLRAGETCAAAYANADAIAYFERAAVLWAPLDRAESARTRVALAKVRERTGERERALETLRRAGEDAAAARARADLRVEILLARTQLEIRGGEGAIDRARQTAEEALEIAHGAHLHELEARALVRIAVALARLEIPESGRRAIELAQRAIELSEDRGALASSLWLLGNVFLFHNDLDRAERTYRDALTASEASREELVPAHCMGNLGMIAFRRFALDEAIEHTQNALARYQRIGDRTRIQEATHNLGFFHHLRGEHALGKGLLENVLADAQGDWILTTSSEEQLADIARVEGDEARAQSYLTDAAAICGRVGVTTKQGTFLGLLAESLWASGQAAASLTALARATQVGGDATLSHGIVLAYLGPVAQAEDCLARLIPIETDPQRRYVTQLVRARMLVWMEKTRDASRLCDELLSDIGAAKIARFHLPVRCLREALDGRFEAAIDTLEQMRRSSSPAELAEAMLDVGTILLQAHEASRVTLARFLALRGEAASMHVGLHHRLDDIGAELHARLGEPDRAASLRERARLGFEALVAGLDSPDRERLMQHPWIAWMRGLRAAAPPAQ